MKKKLVSIFMSLAMLASVVPSVTAAGGDAPVEKQTLETLVKAIPDSLKKQSVDVNTDMQARKSGGSYQNGPVSAKQPSENKYPSFDFKASVDMKSVRDKFTELITKAKELASDPENVANLKVTGEFTVDIDYPSDLNVPDDILQDNKDMNGFGGADIFTEKSRTIAKDTPVNKLSVTVEVAGKADGSGARPGYVLAGELEENLETYLNDLTFTVSGTIPSALKQYIVYGGFSGKTDISYKDAKFAEITYKAVQTAGEENPDKNAQAGKISATVEATEYVQSQGGGGMGGYTPRPSSTASPAPTQTTAPSPSPTASSTSEPTSSPDDGKIEVTFDINGNTTIIPSRESEEEIKVNVDELEVPEMKDYVFAGWYSDPEYSKPVTGEISVDKDTTLYARMVRTTAPDALNSDEHQAYVIGYPEGDVRPLNNITREETSTIFFRLLKDGTRNALKTAEHSFPDVEEGRWSLIEIATMQNGGYVTGYEDGTFLPDRAITRAEFITIATRFLGNIEDKTTDRFTDIAGHWAGKYIAAGIEQGWITGDSGRFRPDDKITRAEAFTIVNRMLVRYVNAEGLNKDAKQWPDNKQDAWYYYQVLEATNSHDFTRQEDKYNENWTQITHNRWVTD